MPQEQNMYNVVALNAANSRLKLLKTARFSLVTRKHGLAAEAALKSFLQTWANQGWEAAVDRIPQDNPNTKEKEGMTYEELDEEAEYIFGKHLDEVNINSQGDYETYLRNITDRIRTIIGQQYQFDTLIDSAETEVADLRAIQNSESRDIK